MLVGVGCLFLTRKSSLTQAYILAYIRLARIFDVPQSFCQTTTETEGAAFYAALTRQTTYVFSEYEVKRTASTFCFNNNAILRPVKCSHRHRKTHLHESTMIVNQINRKETEEETEKVNVTARSYEERSTMNERSV